MSGLHDLKPERVIKTLQRLGWIAVRKSGSHVHMRKEGNPNILSIPVHKGKPIKQGLMHALINKAGLTEKEFLGLYK